MSALYQRFRSWMRFKPLSSSRSKATRARAIPGSFHITAILSNWIFQTRRDLLKYFLFSTQWISHYEQPFGWNGEAARYNVSWTAWIPIGFWSSSITFTYTLFSINSPHGLQVTALCTTCQMIGEDFHLPQNSSCSKFTPIIFLHFQAVYEDMDRKEVMRIYSFLSGGFWKVNQYTD
jgi:hypothetical protein